MSRNGQSMLDNPITKLCTSQVKACVPGFRWCVLKVRSLVTGQLKSQSMSETPTRLQQLQAQLRHDTKSPGPARATFSRAYRRHEYKPGEVCAQKTPASSSLHFFSRPSALPSVILGCGGDLGCFASGGVAEKLLLILAVKPGKGITPLKS